MTGQALVSNSGERALSLVVLQVACKSGAPPVCQALGDSSLWSVLHERSKKQLSSEGTRIKFTDVVLFSGIPHNPRMLFSDALDHGTESAYIELAADCRSRKNLENLVFKNGVSLVTGTGHYDSSTYTFIVDCLCAVRGLSEEQKRRLSKFDDGGLR